MSIFSKVRNAVYDPICAVCAIYISDSGESEAASDGVRQGADFLKKRSVQEYVSIFSKVRNAVYDPICAVCAIYISDSGESEAASDGVRQGADFLKKRSVQEYVSIFSKVRNAV